jgi:hypothetical protein
MKMHKSFCLALGQEGIFMGNRIEIFWYCRTRITDEYTWQIVDTLYEIEVRTSNTIGSTIRNKTVWKNYINTHLYKNIQKDGMLI